MLVMLLGLICFGITLLAVRAVGELPTRIGLAKDHRQTFGIAAMLDSSQPTRVWSSRLSDETGVDDAPDPRSARSLFSRAPRLVPQETSTWPCQGACPGGWLPTRFRGRRS